MWLQAHADCTNADRFNAEKLGPGANVQPHQAAHSPSEHPALSLREIDRFIEALDLDEGRCFATPESCAATTRQCDRQSLKPHITEAP